MKHQICTTCGTEGEGKTTHPGSFLIEIVLWACFLLPGVIYSIWRATSGRKACRACGGTSFVPADSPVGRKLLKAVADEDAATIVETHAKARSTRNNEITAVVVIVFILFLVSVLL